MLSVIVPIYNGERYLKDFIENVQSQTYKEFELILVNDGSTDNTESICKKYEELDPRIVLINKKNEGAGPSRNSGLKIATGNYIMFIDCDDYFENNYFEILYDTIIRNKVDLVICSQKNVIGNKVIEENKTLLTCKEYKNKEEFRADYIYLKKIGISDVLWNKIYSAQIIKDNNLMFPDLRRGQDTVFNINYFDKVNTCITLDKALYYYRFNQFENIFRKFPKNHYDVIYQENLNIENKLKEWGVYNTHAQQYLDLHFLKASLWALVNAFNPKWKYNFKAKYKYISNIINQPKINKCCETKFKCTLFEKLSVILIKQKLIFLLMMLVKTKIILKNLSYKFK